MALVSLIIPTLNAGDAFADLLASLAGQTRPPDEIIVIDSSSTDGTAELARRAGCRVEVIDRARFNHGRTRNEAAAMATGEVLAFMTQDAMPVDEHFLAHLTRPVLDGVAAAAYARQIAAPGAQPTEAFTRAFNYPAESRLQTLDDLPERGVRTFFLSNVAAAYDREAWRRAGRFDPTVIMNEDMLLCAKLLGDGGAVAYRADAAVYHTHNYTLAAQFRRYFDIGVFFAGAADALAGARSGGAGLRFAKGQLAYLARTGRWAWIGRACLEIALKFAGVQLGKRHQRLGRRISRRLSMHKGYWTGRRSPRP